MNQNRTGFLNAIPSAFGKDAPLEIESSTVVRKDGASSAGEDREEDDEEDG